MLKFHPKCKKCPDHRHKDELAIQIFRVARTKITSCRHWVSCLAPFTNKQKTLHRICWFFFHARWQIYLNIVLDLANPTFCNSVLASQHISNKYIALGCCMSFKLCFGHTALSANSDCWSLIISTTELWNAFWYDSLYCSHYMTISVNGYYGEEGWLH